MKKKIRLTEGQFHRLIEQTLIEERKKNAHKHFVKQITESVIQKINEYNRDRERYDDGIINVNSFEDIAKISGLENSPIILDALEKDFPYYPTLKSFTNGLYYDYGNPNISSNIKNLTNFAFSSKLSILDIVKLFDKYVKDTFGKMDYKNIVMETLKSFLNRAKEDQKQNFEKGWKVAKVNN